MSININAHSFIPRKPTTTTIQSNQQIENNNNNNGIISPPHSPLHFRGNNTTNIISLNNALQDNFICHLCQRNSLKHDITIVCNTHPLICFKCMQRCLTRQISECLNDSLICPCYGCGRILTDLEIKRSIDSSLYSFFLSKTSRIPSSPIISPSPPPMNSSRSPSPHHKTSEFIFVKGAINITSSTIYGGGNLPISDTSSSNGNAIIPGGIYTANSENFAANVSSSMVLGRKQSQLVPSPDRYRKMFCNNASGYDTSAEHQFIQELPDNFWNSQNVFGF